MVLFGRFPLGVRAAPTLRRDFSAMLYTVAAILFFLWLVAWLGLHLFGTAIHFLLLLAIVSLVLALVRPAMR